MTTIYNSNYDVYDITVITILIYDLHCSQVVVLFCIVNYNCFKEGAQDVCAVFAMHNSLGKLSMLPRPTYTKITSNRKGDNNDELSILSTV